MKESKSACHPHTTRLGGAEQDEHTGRVKARVEQEW